MGVEIRLMRPVSRWWWIINTAVCVYCFYKRSACLVPPPISPSYPLAASLSFRSLPLPCVLVLLLFLPGVIRPAVSQLEVNAHVSPPSLLSLSLSCRCFQTVISIFTREKPQGNTNCHFLHRCTFWAQGAHRYLQGGPQRRVHTVDAQDVFTVTVSLGLGKQSRTFWWKPF